MHASSTLPLLIAVCIAGHTPPAGAAASCSISDIEIRGMSWRIQGGRYLTVVGDFVNHCAEPIGVQIKVTARDSSGNVVDTDDVWPADMRNIPPTRLYPFSTTVSTTHATVSVAVEVIEVRSW